MKLLHRFALLSLLAAASASAQLRGGNFRTGTTPDKMKALRMKEVALEMQKASGHPTRVSNDDPEHQLPTTPGKMKALRMKKEAVEKEKALRAANITPVKKMKASRMKEEALEKNKA